MRSNIKSVNITESEWGIMEVLWNQAPLSAAEIFEHLEVDNDWNVKTVRSFLDRLIQKKAIQKSKAHGINIFAPIPRRQDCLQKESRSFLDKFFRGNPLSLMRHFIENDQLSEQEIAKLQQILETKRPSSKG